MAARVPAAAAFAVPVMFMMSVFRSAVFTAAATVVLVMVTVSAVVMPFTVVSRTMFFATVAFSMFGVPVVVSMTAAAVRPAVSCMVMSVLASVMSTVVSVFRRIAEICFQGADEFFKQGGEVFLLFL